MEESLSIYGDYQYKASSKSHQDPNILPAKPPPAISIELAYATEKAIKGSSWDARVINFLDEWEKTTLERYIPSNEVQKVIDRFGEKIEHLITKGNVGKFNKWIDSNGCGQWYVKLTQFVLKLPIRAVRNVLRLTYNLVKNIVYTFVHPIKALNHTAQFLFRFINMLSKPEFYTKMGAGMLGAALGNLAVTGGFSTVAYIGLALGGAMLLGGLTAGAFMAAISTKDESKIKGVLNYISEQLKAVPEALLTGFLMGAILSSIKAHSPSLQDPPSPDTIKQWVNNYYIPEHHLPPPTNVTVGIDGGVTLKWSGSQLKEMIGSDANYARFPNVISTGITPDSVYEVHITPENFLMAGGQNPGIIVQETLSGRYVGDYYGSNVPWHAKTLGFDIREVTSEQLYPALTPANFSPIVSPTLYVLTTKKKGKSNRKIKATRGFI